MHTAYVHYRLTLRSSKKQTQREREREMQEQSKILYRELIIPLHSPESIDFPPYYHKPNVMNYFLNSKIIKIVILLL